MVSSDGVAGNMLHRLPDNKAIHNFPELLSAWMDNRIVMGFAIISYENIFSRSIIPCAIVGGLLYEAMAAESFGKCT